MTRISLTILPLTATILFAAPAWQESAPAPQAGPQAAPPVTAAPRKPAPAQPQGQLDASPALFSVMAAINAAGFDAEVDSPANDPLRAAVRKYLAGRDIPCLPDLKRFVAAHHLRDAAAEFTQYVSFALSVDGPPDFAYRFKANEIPPDVLPLAGFEQLMARFHKEANIDDLWRRVQPAIDKAIDRYHEPATRAVMEVNAYLRNPTSGYLGRRFQIYLELLGPPNQIQMKSYADDYFVVLTPSAEPQFADVRHGYLHYLLDPLVMKSTGGLEKKKALIDYAMAAPTLEEYYKTDFILLTTECLIKAVESRLAPAAERDGMVTQALGEGFILTPYFAESLAGYEKQETAMRMYFPDMVKALDLKKEAKRLDGVRFLSERPVRKAKVVAAERRLEPTGVQKTLSEAEDLYFKKDYAKAKELYLRALQETDEKTLHAQAFYWLGKIAVLQRDRETGEQLFRKALDSSPDPQTKAWTHIYLGRLADAADDREGATRNYQAALQVPGAPEAALAAAKKGLNQPFRKQN